MFDKFLEYIESENILDVDYKVIEDFMENNDEYSEEEQDEFILKCIESREKLRLSSESVTEILAYMPDEYVLNYIEEKHDSLDLDIAYLLACMDNMDYVIKTLEEKRVEYGISVDEVHWIISVSDDESFKERCILKGRDIGLNWIKQYELLRENITDKDFKFTFMINDKRSSEQIRKAKLELIENENDEEFTKKCVESYKELGFFSAYSLLRRIEDEEHIRKCIQNSEKYKLDTGEIARLVADKITDDNFKYQFIQEKREEFDKYKRYNDIIWYIINSIDNPEILKEIVRKKELYNLISNQIITTINKINDINFTKECIEKWKQLGLEEYLVKTLISSTKDKEYIKECIGKWEQLGLGKYLVETLISSTNDKEYIKECIEKHDEFGLDGKAVVRLLDYLDEQEYTKSIMLRYKDFDIEDYLVISKILKIEDEEFVEQFISRFDKDEDAVSSWQEECKQQIADENDVILSAPTGSGKTRVFLEWALQKQERPIYITSPIKALSNQRYRELKEQGINVGIETGDVKDVPPDCDIICCTQEIYTYKYTQEKNATCIMDEFHYVFEAEERARAYIVGLHNSKAKNILICSATLGSMEKLKEYIDRVSDRDFYSYEGQARLTKLSYKYRINKEDISDALVIAFSAVGCRSICEELKKSRRDTQKVMPNESNMSQIRELSIKYQIDNQELLDNITYGVAYYFGDLLPKEKAFVEELFENKVIDTVVGTDALAMGVNFPVKNVVFAQTVKYGDKGDTRRISKNLFDQLSGRAGRKGYFDEGTVYICDTFTNVLNAKSEYIEPYNYDTSEEYLGLLMSENEDIDIELRPDIKAILQGKSTIDEEVNFVKKFSTGQRDISAEIERILEDEQEYIDMIRTGIVNSESNVDEYRKEELNQKANSLAEEFEDNIGKVYFEGFEPSINFTLFTKLLGERENIIFSCDDIYSYEESRYEDLLYYLLRDQDDDDDIFQEEDDDDIFQKDAGKTKFKYRELTQMRSYIRQLPSQYRQLIDVMKLEDLIDSMDANTLHQNNGMLSIEEVRRYIGKDEHQIIDNEPDRE